MRSSKYKVTDEEFSSRIREEAAGNMPADQNRGEDQNHPIFDEEPQYETGGRHSMKGGGHGGGHSGGSDGGAIIDVRAKIERAVGGVVVVGELAWRRNDLHVVDAIFAKHLLGHLRPRKARGQGHFRVFLELALQRCRNDPTRQGNADKYNPI